MGACNFVGPLLAQRWVPGKGIVRKHDCLAIDLTLQTHTITGTELL